MPGSVAKAYQPEVPHHYEELTTYYILTHDENLVELSSKKNLYKIFSNEAAMIRYIKKYKVADEGENTIPVIIHPMCPIEE